MIAPLASAHRLLGRLGRDRSGLALLEFAFTLPIVAGIGLYSLEIANFALTNMKISQITLNLADNASRVGADNSLAVQQMREVDANDVLQAARYQGGGLKLTTYGRVTISSLEDIKQSYDLVAIQRIHWQRCIGQMSGTNWDSTFGTTTTTAGTDSTSGNAGTTMLLGMGPVGSQVSAPPGSALMFVEVNYNYQPIVSHYFIGATRMHYIASFIVRDNRDFTQIFNPSPAATKSTCDQHNA